jgi:hypothetical protein
MQDRHDPEQRALDAISHELADSDPGLAGQLSTFNRLVSAEEMPGRERIQPTPRPVPGRPRRPGRRLPLAWIAMLVWLLIAIALLAIALLLRHSASAGTSSAHARAVTTAISATRAMSM